MFLRKKNCLGPIRNAGISHALLGNSLESVHFSQENTGNKEKNPHSKGVFVQSRDAKSFGLALWCMLFISKNGLITYRAEFFLFAFSKYNSLRVCMSV
jgi:hypothetical protein